MSWSSYWLNINTPDLEIEKWTDAEDEASFIENDPTETEDWTRVVKTDDLIIDVRKDFDAAMGPAVIWFYVRNKS